MAFKGEKMGCRLSGRELLAADLKERESFEYLNSTPGELRNSVGWLGFWRRVWDSGSGSGPGVGFYFGILFWDSGLGFYLGFGFGIPTRVRVPVSDAGSRV